MIKHIFSTALFLFYFALPSFSQTAVVVQDLESWATVGVSKRVEEKLKFTLTQGFRFYDNSSQLDQYLGDFSADIKLNSFISITPGIRFIRDRDKGDGTYDNFLRYYGDVNAKHSFNQFTFRYRLRFQMKDELGFAKSDGDFFLNTTRLKAGLKYNIKNWKFDPEFSTEIFRTSGRYTLSEFSKIRMTLGTKYNFKKLGKLGAYYRFEKELGKTYPQTTHIIGLKMIFEL